MAKSPTSRFARVGATPAMSAMGAIGNGGTLYQTRLVSQVQAIDGQIVNAYNTRARGQIDIDDATTSFLICGRRCRIASSRTAVPRSLART